MGLEDNGMNVRVAHRALRAAVKDNRRWSLEHPFRALRHCTVAGRQVLTFSPSFFETITDPLALHFFQKALWYM